MKLLKLLKDRRGVGTIEYALVASIIAIGAISGYHNLGTQVQKSFADVDATMCEVQPVTGCP